MAELALWVSRNAAAIWPPGSWAAGVCANGPGAWAPMRINPGAGAIAEMAIAAANRRCLILDSLVHDARRQWAKQKAKPPPRRWLVRLTYA